MIRTDDDLSDLREFKDEDASFGNVTQVEEVVLEGEGMFDANIGEIRKVLKHLTGVEWPNDKISGALHAAGMVGSDGVLVEPTFEEEEEREEKERRQRDRRHQAIMSGVVLYGDENDAQNQSGDGDTMVLIRRFRYIFPPNQPNPYPFNFNLFFCSGPMN